MVREKISKQIKKSETQPILKRALIRQWLPEKIVVQAQGVNWEEEESKNPKGFWNSILRVGGKLILTSDVAYNRTWKD
jgi:hypothetical protein